MNTKLLHCVFLFFLFTDLPHVSAQTLNDAGNLYYAFNTQEAYTAYESINPGHPDWEAAQLKLARMDWLLFENSQKALTRILDLMQKGKQTDKTLIVWSKMLLEQDKYDESMEKSDQAISSAVSESARYEAQLLFARAVLKKRIAGMQDKEQVDNSSIRTDTLIAGWAAKYPGDIQFAKVALGIAILDKNSELALKSWHSFFRVLNEPTDFLKPAYGKFCGGLNEWAENSGSTGLDLIFGLAESCFYDYAVLLINLSNDEAVKRNSDCQSIIEYLNFLETLEKLTHHFYLATVKNEQNEKAYRQSLISASETLWNNLGWTKSIGKFDIQEFQKEIEKKFKGYSLTGKVNGYYGLHYGHIINDERRNVVQYGQGGELRFISIDNMVSNGYSSWYWDGEAEVGGWAPTTGTILQIRSAYSQDPLTAWMNATDSTQIKEGEIKFAEDERTDDSLAKARPVTYLPGLAYRLKMNAYKVIIDSLRARGIAQQDLRLAFLNAYETIALESGIFAHEGRHSIDLKVNKKLKQPELEFRGKLSELTFGLNPYMSLYTMLSRDIDQGTSPHAIANERIFKAIIDWMEGNKTSIQGLDEKRPMLSQVYKLSASQIKQIAQARDPMKK